MITQWILEKLTSLTDEPVLLVKDSLRLIPDTDGRLHRFATDNAFTVIVASTNLAFRDLYEKVSMSKQSIKMLLLDRSPARRRLNLSLTKAPPPFYPDLLARIPEMARIDISLRQFLMEKTGDPNWPHETNDSRFARLIGGHLKDVIKAHKNLRIADPTRFTDHDFKTIVAFSSLGVPEAAFKKSKSEIYWRIGLLGHQALEELKTLAPEVADPIQENLRNAQAPFCWFADHPPELIIRAFYLSVILSQHVTHWNLLLANIDPDLKEFSNMDRDLIHESASELIAMNPEQAHENLLEIENSLSKENLNFILLDQLKLTESKRFDTVIQKEHYSTLIRSLSLFIALDDILSEKPDMDIHDKHHQWLFKEYDSKNKKCVDQRPNQVWDNLKSAYWYANTIKKIHQEFVISLKSMTVMQTSDLSFAWCRSLWNDKRVNRLEYYISSLERMLYADITPRKIDDLPPIFNDILKRIHSRIRGLRTDIRKLLDDFNRRFQDMITDQYKTWVKKDSAVFLTSQFLRRCVKPHWDFNNEKAIVFVFDGMRYDIWDELARPIFEDRMEIIDDYPATSLLPSETHISRKAIFAGCFPDAFNTKASENKLLKNALKQVFNYDGDVDVIDPEGAGTGETVRYRAGNIDFYIFELCDKELHNIRTKKSNDGQIDPARPLAFIYQQHIKNILETEVMAIIRNIPADTKVFVVADHGFGAIGQNPIKLELSCLNDKFDCNYQNAWIRQSLDEINASRNLRSNMIEFSVTDLKMPDTIDIFDRSSKQTWQKQFASVIFPKTGFAFSRPKSYFKPDYYFKSSWRI